jgi:hypothetical protein
VDGLIDEGGNPRVSKGAMRNFEYDTLAHARVSALLPRIRSKSAQKLKKARKFIIKR